MSPISLADHLNRVLAALRPGPIALGYSGGADSHALLHALAHSAQARERGLRALHVDHGLHPGSARWSSHCRAVAADLGVAIEIMQVSVQPERGTGLEDAARTARMTAFAQALHRGEILSLAHHRDDQAETVLLKLLRGAGPEGLGGMRSLRAWRGGYLWRPLLDLPRAALLDYARAHGLHWLDDPSNADTRLRRNFLRAEILPRLKQRWPHADAALAHSAGWARAAHEFIDAEAGKALTRLQGADVATLDWRGWLALPAALRDPVLRRWLRTRGLDEPAHWHVAELERQLIAAAHDRQPCIGFANTELRRYRDRLYARRPCAAPAIDWQAEWDGAPITLPDGGRLSLAPPARWPEPLLVRYRRGGERLRPAGGAHTRELRLLLQEAGVPPWQRDRLPLVYVRDELIAVADLFLSDAAQSLCARVGTQLVWKPDDEPG